MRNFLSIFFISLFFFSCLGKDKIPKEILPIDKMKNVIWDLVKAGELAAYDTTIKKNISLKDSAEIFFNRVFTLHHINKNIFYSSYNFYLQNPQWGSVLMDSVDQVANRERVLQYMHPPKIPQKVNQQFNKIFLQNMRRNALKKNIPKADSTLKKIQY